MNMRRKWQRLGVCVSLAAFLVVNTPASSAIAAHLFAPRPSDWQTTSGRCPTPAVLVGDKTTHSDCCHCSKHKKRIVAEIVCKQASRCRPDCPDCPKGPSAPKCPCPGGCALCNVAKVPHIVPTTCPPCSLICYGTNLVESTFIYTPPFYGRMIRPPRA